MRQRVVSGVVGLVLVVAFMRCLMSVWKVGSGAPQGGGAQRVFMATEDETTNAIGRAFADWQYHGMQLFNAVDYQTSIPGWHATNGFLLFPINGPMATIPLKERSDKPVRYVASFHIVTERIAPTATRVSVRTIKASIISGREPSVHGGWADHLRDIASVPQEETNVLSAIATELQTSR